jgi:N-acetylneuraminic acid mutarotase
MMITVKKKPVLMRLPFLFLAGFSLLTILSSSSCGKDDSEDDLVGNWKRRSEFEGVGRTEAVTFTIGDKVYVGGGYDGSDRLQDYWSFDQNTGTWKPIANFPGVARSSAVAFSINGKGYVGTGYDDDDNRLKDFWEYDPVTNNWTRKTDFAGTARYGALGFSIGAKGYITTGYDGNYLKDMWEYNAATNNWIQKSSSGGSKRSDAALFIYNSRAYVIGGFNNGSYLNDLWVYDPAADSWTEKRKISSVSDDDYDDDYGDNIRRANAMTFVMGTRGFITNGARSGITGSTWQYDFNSDVWSEKTAFEGAAREGGMGFSVNNRGYIVAGNNSSFRFDDLWEFFPDAEQDDDDN